MVKLDKTEKTIVAVWLVWLLLALAFWGSVAYIAVHFISKAW